MLSGRAALAARSFAESAKWPEFSRCRYCLTSGTSCGGDLATISGAGTHFAQDATQVMLAAGLATSAVVANGETGLTVQVTVVSGIWPSRIGLAAELAANIAVAGTLAHKAADR
jgi:hypothetical protein